MLKFDIKPLIKAIRALAPLYGQRGKIEALKSVKLLFCAARITVTASDLETTAELVVPAAWTGEVQTFAAIINAKQLLAALGSMQGKIATAERLQGDLPGLRLTDEVGAIVNLNGAAPPADFPHAPETDLTTLATLPAHELVRLVRVAGVAMAAENNRFSIAGVKLEFGPKGVRAVATDGRRMTVGEAAGTIASTRKLIITAPAIEVLAGIEPSGEVAIAADAEWVEVRSSRGRLTTKVSDQAFPPYQGLLTHHYATHASVDRAALSAALQRAVSVDRKHPRSVWQLDPTNGSITISATADAGAVSLAVPAEIEGVALRIGLQPQQVLGFLCRVAEDKIAVDLDGPDNQARLWATGVQMLVMPIRL